MKLPSMPSRQVAAAALVAAISAQSALAQNLLANGEMNVSNTLPLQTLTCTGNVPAGALPFDWYDNTCNTGGSGVNYLVDSSVYHSGPTGLTVTSTNASTPAAFYEPFTMRAGYKYSAIVYVKGNGSTPQKVVVKLRMQGTPYTSYAVASAYVNNTGYKQLVLNGVAPLDQLSVPAMLRIEATTPGTIYVDSASVVETAAVATDVTRVGNTLAQASFGVHEHRDSGIPLSFLGASGPVGARRIWDVDGAQLGDIFPTAASRTDDSQRNWTVFDQVLADATSRGIQLIMTLGGHTPSWAVEDPSVIGMKGCDYWGPGTSAPVDTDIFNDMVTAVIARAAGRIKYWEVWNEPYNCSAFTNNNMGSLNTDAALLKARLGDYNTSHPGANLMAMSPSFSAEEVNLPALDQYAARGGFAWAQIVSVHAYDSYLRSYLQNPTQDPTQGRPDAPEAYFIKDHKISMLKNILNKYSNAANKPVWDTESGYVNTSTTPTSASPQTVPMDDTAGAQYVARHLLLGSLAGLDASFYYAWDQDAHQSGNGTTYTNSVSLGRSLSAPLPNFCNTGNPCVKTAAGTAYATMANWLTGATIKELNVNGASNPTTLPADGGTQWIVKLQRTVTVNGSAQVQDQWIVWNPNATATSTPVSVTVPGTFISARSLDGSKRSIVNNTVGLTGSPKLLTPN